MAKERSTPSTSRQLHREEYPCTYKPDALFVFHCGFGPPLDHDTRSDKRPTAVHANAGTLGKTAAIAATAGRGGQGRDYETAAQKKLTSSRITSRGCLCLFRRRCTMTTTRPAASRAAALRKPPLHPHACASTWGARALHPPVSPTLRLRPVTRRQGHRTQFCNVLAIMCLFFRIPRPQAPGPRGKWEAALLSQNAVS